MAEVAATIGATFAKGVFRRTASKKRKSGAEIGPTVSDKETTSTVSTKSEAEGLEGAGEI